MFLTEVCLLSECNWASKIQCERQTQLTSVGHYLISIYYVPLAKKMTCSMSFEKIGGRKSQACVWKPSHFSLTNSSLSMNFRQSVKRKNNYSSLLKSLGWQLVLKNPRFQKNSKVTTKGQWSILYVKIITGFPFKKICNMHTFPFQTIRGKKH